MFENLARCANTATETLSILAKHPRWSGRHFAGLLGRHPNTTADTLVCMVEGGAPSSICAALDHPNLPVELLRKRLRDPEMVWAARRAFLAGRGQLSWYRPADLERLDAANSERADEYTALLQASGNPALYRELAATWSGTSEQLRETIANLTASAA